MQIIQFSGSLEEDVFVNDIFHKASLNTAC